jgi:error-prone DNA polymerase
MGEEEETYPNEAIREVLHKTLGVPIFQEQAMRLAVVAAGFTPGEADQLRRAMAAWRRPGLIDQFRQKLLAGMRANNLPEEFAQRVYQQIEGFGEYGFPESHAASFALLVYVSAWLKHHYPAAFAAAMINSQPMGFYQPAQLVRDARDHGVAVRPVDVNHSAWDCTLEGEDFGFRIADCGLGLFNPQSEGTARRVVRNPQSFLRLGFRMLNGVGEAVGRAIERARQQGPFVSIDDFARRTGLGQAVVKRLAAADAFGSVGAGRRQALWQALGQEKKRREMPLFELEQEEDCKMQNAKYKLQIAEVDSSAINNLQFAICNLQSLNDTVDRPPQLPTMQLYEEVVADYCTAGLSLRAHPISFYRKELARLGVTPARRLVELANDAPVIVAGLVLLRQRPGTAKGITFVTLEDETGTVNLVVHQHTWDRFYRIARRAPAWIAHGHAQTTRGMPSLAETCSREAKGLQGERGHDPASREHATPVIHVVVSRLEALGEQLRELDVKARDFR